MAGTSSGIGATQVSFFSFIIFLGFFMRLQCVLVHSEVSSLRHATCVPEYFEGKPQGTMVSYQRVIRAGEMNPNSSEIKFLSVGIACEVPDLA